VFTPRRWNWPEEDFFRQSAEFPLPRIRYPDRRILERFFFPSSISQVQHFCLGSQAEPVFFPVSPLPQVFLQNEPRATKAYLMRILLRYSLVSLFSSYPRPPLPVVVAIVVRESFFVTFVTRMSSIGSPQSSRISRSVEDAVSNVAPAPPCEKLDRLL